MQNMKLERFMHHIVDGRGIYIRHYLINEGRCAALHHGIYTLLAASKGAAR